MNIDWQSLLLGSIPGFLALVAVVYGKVQDRKQKAIDSDKDAAARREPTWNELVTENRNLRAEVDDQREDIDKIKEDLAQYKRTTNRKFRAFENMLRAVFDQWPVGFEHPLFNSDDLTELRDADIPWKDRIRPGVP